MGGEGPLVECLASRLGSSSVFLLTDRVFNVFLMGNSNKLVVFFFFALLVSEFPLGIHWKTQFVMVKKIKEIVWPGPMSWPWLQRHRRNKTRDCSLFISTVAANVLVPVFMLTAMESEEKKARKVFKSPTKK